jgi:hypothetical protein
MQKRRLGSGAWRSQPSGYGSIGLSSAYGPAADAALTGEHNGRSRL